MVWLKKILFDYHSPLLLMRLTHHLGKLFLLVILIGSTWRAAAQDTLTVAPAFVHFDAGHQLLLINAPLAALRPTDDSLRALQCGGRLYTFAHALSHLNSAVAYQAASAGGPCTVYFTRLPVLAFTARQPVADTPYVYARMVLADTTGQLAQVPMGIQFRGSYTQSLAKKSYELSLWTDSTGKATQNLPLLGLRNDATWNLQAMYNDPLRLRLKMANELWQQINQPYYQALEPTAKTSIAFAYVEVFKNGSYQGIYTLTERIDRKQLQLKKYTSNSIQGELYKGVSLDSAVVYRGAPPFSNSSPLWSGFEYQEPSQKTDWTSLHDFVSFVVHSPDTAFYRQFPARFNQASAVDYFLFLNLLRATDNTGKNLYVAKYKAGEPYFFVPWDLDGTYGDDWTGANQNITNDLLSNGLFDRLQRSYCPNGFWPAAVSRWASLRASILTESRLLASLNSNHALLLRNAVYAREQLAWPAYQYDSQQLSYSATWLTTRLAYLDQVFTYQPLATTNAASSAAGFQLYPNPTSGYLYVQAASSAAQFDIQDMNGRRVLQTTLPGGSARLDISSLPQGVYLARLSVTSGVAVKKLVIQ
jgi:spore coat protein H